MEKWRLRNLWREKNPLYLLAHTLTGKSWEQKAAHLIKLWITFNSILLSNTRKLCSLDDWNDLSSPLTVPTWLHLLLLQSKLYLPKTFVSLVVSCRQLKINAPQSCCQEAISHSIPICVTAKAPKWAKKCYCHDLNWEQLALEAGEEYSHNAFHYMWRRFNLQQGSMAEQPVNDRD